MLFHLKEMEQTIIKKLTLGEHSELNGVALKCVIECFTQAAATGNLSQMKHLQRIFKLNVKDLCYRDSKDNLPFEAAAEAGHLHVLQWMTSEFLLTKNSLKHVAANAHTKAAENGHLSVLQWMEDVFY